MAGSRPADQGSNPCGLIFFKNSASLDFKPDLDQVTTISTKFLNTQAMLESFKSLKFYFKNLI